MADDGIEYISGGGGGGEGVTDHGALTGLADDDHTAYATNAELTAHEGAADPHPTYETSAEAATKVSTHTALPEAHHPDHRINGGKETVQAHGAMGATETFDLANGNVHSGTLDAACTFTFSGATASTGCSLTLILTQDATGSRLVTWPASVDWPGGAAPTLSTGASKVDVLTFLSTDGGTTWLGFTSGLDLR